MELLFDDMDHRTYEEMLRHIRSCGRHARDTVRATGQAWEEAELIAASVCDTLPF